MPTTSELAEILLETAPEHEGWSLVESRNAAGRYEELLDWAREMTTEQWFADITVRRPKVGLVLLWLESEVARRKCLEGSLWPILGDREIVPWRKELHAELFLDAAHATQPHRVLLRHAAKYYSLRNTFEDEGQNWYRLIYLQFGFTHDDAVQRLAPWLSGQVLPVSVQCLLEGNDSGAQAFQQLWSSLRLFRLGNLPKDVLNSRLKSNPWVLPEWSGDLIKAALRSQAQIPRLSDLEAAEVEFFTAPKLNFSVQGTPFFTTCLSNLSALGLESSDYQFRAGTQVLARLMRQPDGTYASDAPEEIVLPTKPDVALALVDQSERIVAYATATLWDLMEEVTRYTTRTGRMLLPDERLRVGAGACFIAAGDVSFSPAPERSCELSMGYFLHVIAPGWSGRVEAMIDDEVIWSTAAAQSNAGAVNSTITAEFTEELNLSVSPWNQLPSPWSLPIRFRIPVGWTFDRLRWRRSDGFLVELGQLPTHLTLIESDAVHPVVLRVRITNGESAHTEVLRVPVPFVAVLKWGRDGLPRRHGQVQNLLLSEARQVTWSFCMPRQDGYADGPREFTFAEGDRLIGQVKSRPSMLPELGGYGAPLQIFDDPYQQNDPVLTVADCVLEGGVIGAVKWSAENHGYEIRSRFLELGEDHCLLAWSSRDGNESGIAELPLDQLDSKEDGWFWKVEEGVRLHAVALTFRGTCLGSWFDHLTWSKAIAGNGIGSIEETAAMLRTWKAPILKTEGGHVERMTRWMGEHWAAILPVWLASGSIEFSTQRRWHLPATDANWTSAIGDLLMEANPVPDAEAVGDLVEALAPETRGIMSVGCAMWKIADVCPILAARVVRVYLEEFVKGSDRRAFFGQILALPDFSNSDERAEELGIIHGRRDGYWLQRTVPMLAAIETSGRTGVGRSYRLLSKSSAYRLYALGRWLREIQ